MSKLFSNKIQDNRNEKFILGFDTKHELSFWDYNDGEVLSTQKCKTISAKAIFGVGKARHSYYILLLLYASRLIVLKGNDIFPAKVVIGMPGNVCEIFIIEF